MYILNKFFGTGIQKQMLDVCNITVADNMIKRNEHWYGYGYRSAEAHESPTPNPEISTVFPLLILSLYSMKRWKNLLLQVKMENCQIHYFSMIFIQHLPATELWQLQ